MHWPRALRGVALAVTVEAHYLSGGLGSLVSEVVAESGLACRVVRCGVADLPECVGSEAFMNDAHGLSAEAIARTAIEALEPRDKAAEHRRHAMKKLSASSPVTRTRRRSRRCTRA